MEITERLSKHFDDVQKLYPDVVWYGKKADLDDIDVPGAILTYSSDSHSADHVPHYSIVTLTLYLTNNSANTYELTHLLGYYAVDEPSIDMKFNYTAAFQKRVIVL